MSKRFVIIGVLLSLISSACIAQPSAHAAYQKDKRVLEANPDLETVPNSVLVKFIDVMPPQAANRALAAVNAALIRTFKHIPGLTHIRTQMPVEQAVAILSNNPWVEYAEPDYVVKALKTPNDTNFYEQWGLLNYGQTVAVTGTPGADISMTEAWDVTTGTGAPNCVVAVIDTGVHWSHPDLSANIWTNPGEIAGDGIDNDNNGYIDDIRGWDFVANDNNPDDENGHGTHVAGIIAAVGNNNMGVAGVAWNCKIVPIRVLGTNGSGANSTVILGIDYVIGKGIKVSNNSYGGGFSSALSSAIRSGQSIGHVFVAAAGNERLNTDTSPMYPASYDLDNIIPVAATDNRDNLASFSNYGATTVDLGAPGVDIISTWKSHEYRYSSGTSMAAPHVAGVAALVYQLHGGFSGYSYHLAKCMILSTTRPISALAGKTVTGGVLDAYAALNAPLSCSGY